MINTALGSGWRHGILIAFSVYTNGIPNNSCVIDLSKELYELKKTTDLSMDSGWGVAVRLTSGQILEIENIRGNQVVDTWALTQADVLEYSSMDHTRSVNSNLFYQTGMTVVSNHRRPLFTLIADSTPGWHDTLLCPCNAAIYREMGCRDYHRSCTDNFHEALAAHGLSLPFTPASLNLFMNVPVAADGALDRVPPRSVAGDTLQLRAECDIWLVLSACPQDITPINGAARQPPGIGLRWGVAVAGRQGTA